jgi:hypothetical protein
VAFAAIFASGGTVLVSQNALPGDFLYSVKVEVEEFRLLISSDELDANLYLQFAAERVEEMNALLERGRLADVWAASERLDFQLEALLILTEGSGTQEQVSAFINLSENYYAVVEKIKQIPVSELTMTEAMLALKTSQDHIHSLLYYGAAPLQNESMGGVSVNGLPNSVEMGGSPGEQHPQATATPALWLLTPTSMSGTATADNTTVTATQVSLPAVVITQVWFTTTSVWFTTTPVWIPTQTVTLPPTVTQTPPPTATTWSYPAPSQPTATTSGYPAPPQPTSQPTATTSGYPAPPQPTTQPTTQPANPTQPGYPPPAQPTKQPSPPAYP